MAGWTQPLRPVCTLPRREVALAAMRIGGDDIAVKVATPLRAQLRGQGRHTAARRRLGGGGGDGGAVC
jgi:hypothetical protein